MAPLWKYAMRLEPPYYGTKQHLLFLRPLAYPRGHMRWAPTLGSFFKTNHAVFKKKWPK